MENKGVVRNFKARVRGSNKRDKRAPAAAATNGNVAEHIYAQELDHLDLLDLIEFQGLLSTFLFDFAIGRIERGETRSELGRFLTRLLRQPTQRFDFRIIVAFPLLVFRIQCL